MRWTGPSRRLSGSVARWAVEAEVVVIHQDSRPGRCVTNTSHYGARSGRLSGPRRPSASSNRKALRMSYAAPFYYAAKAVQAHEPTRPPAPGEAAPPPHPPGAVPGPASAARGRSQPLPRATADDDRAQASPRFEARPTPRPVRRDPPRPAHRLADRRRLLRHRRPLARPRVHPARGRRPAACWSRPGSRPSPATPRTGASGSCASGPVPARSGRQGDRDLHLVAKRLVLGVDSPARPWRTPWMSTRR